MYQSFSWSIHDDVYHGQGSGSFCSSSALLDDEY